MKRLKVIPTFIALLGLTAIPAALAEGCCGRGQAGGMAGCDMPGHSTATAGHEGHTEMEAPAVQASGARQVFMQPVQSVFDNYIKIQGALAQDSLRDVGGTASAIAQAVRGDSRKMLSPKIAEQADALAKAKDLPGARTAFKALSESLIAYVEQQKIPAGSYYVAYCPMAKVSWLQTDKTIMNPYMGQAMIHCGEIQS